MKEELIKVGDKTYRSAQVIMLPTEDRSNLYIQKKELHDEVSEGIGKIHYNKNNSPSGINKYFSPQHLYIVTSEEIKEGDWVIDNNILCKAVENFPSTDWCKKLIAFTDFRINLPRPSSDFIKKYCELNGEVKDVLVEYEKIPVDIKGDIINITSIYEKPSSINNVTDYIKCYDKVKLKVASDNTISIIKKPEEKLYTKEELKDYVTLAWACCSATTYKEGDDIGADCEDWIKTHIKK